MWWCTWGWFNTCLVSGGCALAVSLQVESSGGAWTARDVCWIGVVSGAQAGPRRQFLQARDTALRDAASHGCEDRGEAGTSLLGQNPCTDRPVSTILRIRLTPPPEMRGAPGSCCRTPATHGGDSSDGRWWGPAAAGGAPSRVGLDCSRGPGPQLPPGRRGGAGTAIHAVPAPPRARSGHPRDHPHPLGGSADTRQLSLASCASRGLQRR